MKDNKWFPAEFERLNNKLLLNTTEAKRRGYQIKTGENGKHYVSGLGKAASKYKLANAISDVQYSDYTHETRLLYTVQFKLMAAFVAFEAYGRLRKNNSWRNLALECFPIDQKLVVKVRDLLSKGDLDDLRGFMNSSDLRKRLDRYKSGVDAEIFAVAYAMRNGFAHGLYGSRRQFNGAAKSLRNVILTSIKQHCNDQTIAINVQ